MREITRHIIYASMGVGIVFALHREIKGHINQVQVTRDALGGVYITFTEDYSEVVYEPKDR